MNNEIYNYYNFNCLDLIKLCTLNLDGYSGFLVGNAIKYVYRAGIKTKEPTQDLFKALDYLREYDKIKDIHNKIIISSKDFYKYILFFSEMEHYKNNFFNVLLYNMCTNFYYDFSQCIKILETEINYLQRMGI